MIAASIGNTHHFDEDEVFIRRSGPLPPPPGLPDFTSLHRDKLL